jgi:hypothetical protein
LKPVVLVGLLKNSAKKQKLKKKFGTQKLCVQQQKLCRPMLSNAKLQGAGMQIIDPVEHASRHGDEQDKYSDMVQAAEDQARADFLTQAKKGDANAVCIWAGTVTDYANANGVTSTDKLPRRARTFAEVATDALDLGNGPSMCEVIQVLLNAASDNICTQSLARGLLARMADAHAYYAANEAATRGEL